MQFVAGYSRHFLAFAEIDLEWGRCFFAGPRQCQAVERLKNVVGHNNESSAFVAPWKELLHGVVHSLALATINYAHCSYTMSIVYSKLDLGTVIAPLKGKHKDIDSFVVHTNTQLLDFALTILYSKHHAAERWDLEFGSNTNEKFENSWGEAEWVFKFFCGVWKPNSKSHLSTAWCLLLTPRHQKIERVFKISSDFSNFE